MSVSPSGDDDAGRPSAAVRAVLQDPGAGVERLPALLESLAAGDRRERVSAAWALCLVATDGSTAADRIRRRVADRFGDDRSPEVTLVLSYLDDALASPSGQSSTTPSASRGETGVDASDAAAPPDRSPRHPSEERPMQPGDRRGTGDHGDERGTGPESDETQVRTTVSDRGRGDAGPGTRRRHERALERAAAAAGMDRIADGSRFAELHPVALPTEGRFSTVYRTRAVTADGEELGLALQLIDPPGRDPAGFAADLARALRTWEWVADHELVVTLHDWGTEPHCWLLTDATEATLYDRMGRGIDEPLRYGTCVAEALAYAHERGVVHAGLDPSSVVFSGTIAERERPRVTNVGLLSAMRTHADPAAYLDPRYAAPEYFDRQFGDVNAATDVYQLGAVLYSLLTGEPPFDGDYETVRHAILDRRPTVPSARNPAVPERIDDVVMKAMAKQKIARYESVAQLRRELAVSRGR